MLYVWKSECWLPQTPEYQHFNKEKMHADAHVHVYNYLQPSQQSVSHRVLQLCANWQKSHKA